MKSLSLQERYKSRFFDLALDMLWVPNRQLVLQTTQAPAGGTRIPVRIGEKLTISTRRARS
jgi:hypothetical protein